MKKSAVPDGVHPNKSLGQHWLYDASVLNQIADCANLTADDTVLEIGPGLGTLTEVLSEKARKVIAVEFDAELAEKLTGAYANVEVINADFLQFDFATLPTDYKVVANIPYYITAKIVQKLVTSTNKPSIAVLLVQREVTERLAAKPGGMSVLTVSAQLYAEVGLGPIVKSELFTPPPKVDSQVVILKTRATPLFSDLDERQFFRIVKAGFSERRKKLRSSLAGSLGISKTEAEQLLSFANIDPNLRAQDLSLENWYNLTQGL